MSVPLLVGRLVCPNDCGHVAPLIERPGIPIGGGTATLHECGSLSGMLVPLVPEGLRAEARAVEREDYVGSEKVRHDAEGRAIMRTEVVSDNRTDVAVFAPCATAGVSNG